MMDGSMAERKKVVLMRGRGEQDEYDKVHDIATVSVVQCTLQQVLTEHGYEVHFVPAIQCQLVRLDELSTACQNLQQYSGRESLPQHLTEPTL